MFIMIMWVVVYQIEQNDHRRDQRACALYLCYSHPSVRLGLRLQWTLSLLPCRCTGRLFSYQPPGEGLAKIPYWGVISGIPSLSLNSFLLKHV
jgi:hypothetical protein